ncbi:hypothetical protein ONZ45_g6280 [Pleurotus djamor]|nr:hypothetical protein ONZ45_g6280 [Pleurotus djamor]
MNATPVEGLRPHPVVDVTITTQKVDPDRILRIQQAHDFPRRLLWIMAAFTALVSVLHIVSLLSVFVFPRKAHKSDGTRKRPSLQRLPAAIVDTFRVMAFRWTVQLGGSYSINLAEAFLTAGYVVLIFVWSLVHSTNSKGMVYDPKYWANTAGNVAATQLSVVAALGTRNNVISWLTGVSFDKLNLLHRMTARALCILGWVHGAGRMMLGIQGAVGWSHPFTQAGLLASIAFTILCLLSIRPIRNFGYEAFLILHFLLVFIVVLSSYFHAEEFDLGYFVWPAFVIWGLDRLIQFVRTLAINAKYFPRGRKPHDLDAKVDVLSPHFLRLTLRRPNFFHWRPGQSAFLTLPSVSTLPFETHPFTISTVDGPTDRDEASEKANEPSQGKELSFLIRVRRGFTERLLNAAGKEETMKVLVDGPYSSPPWLRGFDTVVLIAGGSGVAFTLPMLLDLIRRSKSGLPNECHKVTFVWAIREFAHIQWIADVLEPALKDLPSDLIVEIQIFVTGAVDDTTAPSLDDDSTHSDSESQGQEKFKPQGNRLLQSSMVRVENKRPDLEALIQNEILRSNGSMSVNVCGTHALAGVVRSALGKPRFMDILKGGPSVTLHVEAFGSY